MSYTEDVEALGLLQERLCLDFVNSSGTHPHQAHNDFLTTYDHLIQWARFVGLISENDMIHLLDLARQYPLKAERTLEQAIELRETLYRILAAQAREASPDEADLLALIETLTAGLPQMRLARGANGWYEWTWSGEADDLARMLWPVAWDATELLKSDHLQYIRECAGENCNWLFLDTSRNHSRRWCDMKQCGNRAKARTHYHRTRITTHDN
jgi:predicted RNA-binding Zn ribbon-like protein